MEGHEETGHVPHPVDDDITLQLLRPPALEGPLSIDDAVEALRKAYVLVRNVPFSRDQRLVLLRWSEAWLQLGMVRLSELARKRATNESSERLARASELADIAHRDVLQLIQRVEAGQVFELVGMARYYLCRAMALARDQERLDLDPHAAPPDW